MKKLQCNFTTPEQSKRLLELGVPADSADCYFRLDLYSYKTEMCFTKEDSLLHHYTPCWSVGRLIEIYCLCVDERYSIEFIGQIHTRPMNKILDLFESVKFDFLKLEE